MIPETSSPLSHSANSELMGELLAPGWLLEVCKAAGGPLGGLETFNGVWSALACTTEFLGQFPGFCRPQGKEQLACCCWGILQHSHRLSLGARTESALTL